MIFFWEGLGLFPAPTVSSPHGPRECESKKLLVWVRAFSKPTHVGNYTNSDPNKPYTHNE